jgi:hypothetical protein
MLGNWRTTKGYQVFVLTELKSLALNAPLELIEYKDIISKLLILDLDYLCDLATEACIYSDNGRPALYQPEIFRSFIIMNDLGIPLNNWPDKLEVSPILRIAAGFQKNILPGIATYYDFMNRFMKMDERPRIKAVKLKPKEKLKKGEKLPPKNPGIVDSLVTKIIDDEKKFTRRLARRPERFLQKIFASVCVEQSIQDGLIPNSVSISGDGTCIETGASNYGVKCCTCKEKGIYNCTCDRRFSDPNAVWGWDSNNERYFYGYTGYFITTYNKPLKTDLPLTLRLVSANRHDSVSAVFSLVEFRELYPNLHIDTFISDSASDNYATYKLLNYWNINAVIALNHQTNHKNKYPPITEKNGKGVPICPAGHEMVNGGYCKDYCRCKWRCPRIAGNAERCEQCDNCSKSKYGRVIYTKTDGDIRLFTKIPRGTPEWKAKMKERTAAERVNNRILHHYGIENSATRGKKRISFFVTIAGFNIHLDARLKKMRAENSFPFEAIFETALEIARAA